MATMDVKDLVEAVDQCRDGFFHWKSFFVGYCMAIVSALVGLFFSFWKRGKV